MNDADSQARNLAICIVGGGAAGLAALKTIMDTPQYAAGLWHPTVFEERENIGGTWLPAAPDSDPPVTALYDSLTTNIPHPLMAFNDFPFPPSTPLFPKAAAVQSYLEAYRDRFGLDAHIRFNDSVQNVRRDDHDRWQVRLSNGDTLDFDTVLVANGHHRVPRYPNTPGLSTWRAKGKAWHSAQYRNPQPFAGRSVLVVGGGPSGKDIAAELSTVARSVVHAVSGDTIPEATKNFQGRGRVAAFQDNGRVIFEDGTVQDGIDHCILATGFQVSFPFLPPDIIRTGTRPSFEPLQRDLENSTYHVFPLAKHIFPVRRDLPPGSLAFLGLPVRVSPFPLVEAQARAVVRVLAHPDALDLDAEMHAITDRYHDLRARLGDDPLLIAKRWDKLPSHEQFEYRDRLYEFAEADPGRRVVVQPWMRDMYSLKYVLKPLWKEVEKSGESEQWLAGVGNGGAQDWVCLAERLLRCQTT